MDLEMVARTIQLIIAPAVMITACCIFTNGLLALYAAIGERLHVTVREWLDLLQETETNRSDSFIVKERLEDIDRAGCDPFSPLRAACRQSRAKQIVPLT